jgi:hypothetical protein
MPDQVMGPSQLAHSDHGQQVALWVDILDATEQFLLAGLRQKVGPQGDVAAAYRAWYREAMREHDQMIHHLVEEFDRRGRDYGC